MADISVDLKYELYENSVQCHDADIDFLNEEFERHRKRKPLTLREDFGGTAAMACDWVKQSTDHISKAIDLDPEPVDYGKKTHYIKLSDEEKNRMEYIMGNVMHPYEFKSDVIVAFNFSYFIFKKRSELLEYFSCVRKGLKEDGMFFLDIFGGEEAGEVQVEETEHEDHSYFWDLDKYNPLTSECQYYIHFKTHKDNRKYHRVFSYDWRMWSVQEIREILEEAGFSKVVTYWEGEDEDGDGDGEFYVSDNEENCESWVTYIGAMA